jgi:hypothetical protein
MARFDAAAFDYAPANDWSIEEVTKAKPAKQVPAWSESESPTRPLPVFRLEEEARRLDEAAAAASAAAAKSAACGEDATVTVSAEENLKLLASVFAGASNDATNASNASESSDAGPVTKRSSVAPYRNTDDEPTLDASAPSTPEALAAVSMQRPVRVTARPPALKMLVITRPPPAPHKPRASVVPAPAPAPAAASRTDASAPLGDSPSGLHLRIDRVASRPAPATYPIRRAKRDMQTYLVVGIWAMALSLLAVLMFMATSSA